MHSSCLLPGLYTSCIMLEQSAITVTLADCAKLQKELKIELKLFCFSRNVFFSKQFRYVHISLPKTTDTRAGEANITYQA